ncbi:hypothetical protein LIER_27196 [Lithospermum erythrorhizon]|uniref:Uncharacterized protein n=1 Tax=Lithospermum erythrorhizon TaxID=34254 RepID=A0AAV3RB65_LITER
MPLDPPLCVKLARRPKKARRRATDEVNKKGEKKSCPQTPNHEGGRPEKGEQSGRGNNTGKGRGRGSGRGTTDATEASASQSTSQATPRRYTGPQGKKE